MAAVVEDGEVVFSGAAEEFDPELNTDLEELLTKNARARTIDSIDDELLTHEDLCDVGVRSKEPGLSMYFYFKAYIYAMYQKIYYV